MRYQIPILRFLPWPHTGIISRISVWFVVILIIYLTSLIAIHLVSLGETESLIPISMLSIIHALPLICLSYSAGIILVRLLSRVSNCIELFTIAFFLRVITGIILAFTLQLDDEQVFHYTSIEQASKASWWSEAVGYYYVVGIIYAGLGSNLLLPKVVNALLGSLLPFFAYDLARRFFSDPKAAWYTFLFTAFLPPLVIFSAFNLKEIATAFLPVLALWFLLVPHQYVLWKIIGVFASVGAIYWLRGAPWTVLVLAGVITYIVLGETWRLRYLVRQRFLSNLFLIGLLIFFASSFLINPIYERTLSRSTKETYFVKQFADSSATVMRFVDRQNPLSPRNVAVLFFRGLYSPAPIRLLIDRNLTLVIEALVMTTWYVLFPFAMAGLLAERHKGAVAACGIMALGIAIMAAIGVMAGSDPYRHRIGAMGLLFILAGGGLNREYSRKYSWVFYLWWLGASLFIIVWIIFKI
jgi:hypothetical protein